jgi:hypothetical protein
LQDQVKLYETLEQLNDAKTAGTAAIADKAKETKEENSIASTILDYIHNAWRAIKELFSP